MNSSIPAISSGHPVSPSFGSLVSKSPEVLAKIQKGLGRHYDTFEKGVNSIKGADVIVDETGLKVAKAGSEEAHSIVSASPIYNYMGRWVVNFENNLSYIPQFRMVRHDFEKYGKDLLQKTCAAIEYVAKELSNPENEGKFVNLFGQFHK